MVYITSLYQKLMEEETERLYEPEVIDNTKEREFSRYKRADAYMNSQKLWPLADQHKYQPDME